MKKLLLIALLIVGCEETTEPQAEDCAGVVGGSAANDDCGLCTGGTTGLEVNYLKDCAGECGGDAVLSGCDNLCNSTAVLSGCDNACNSTAALDCAGECSGDAQEDNCGVCDSDSSNDNTPSTGICDCAGTINGSLVVDCAGECGGGLVEDCKGACGGNAELDGIECGGCDLPDLNIYIAANGSVLYNSSEDIGAFQLRVEGATILGILSSGLVFEGSPYTPQFNPDTGNVLAITHGVIMPAGCGVLMTFQLDGTVTGVTGIIFVNPTGSTDLNFEYYSGGG